MKRTFLAFVTAMLFTINSVVAFTISDGEGNKVKVSPLGVKVISENGDKVTVNAAGVKVSSSSGDKVKVNAAGVKASGKEKSITITTGDDSDLSRYEDTTKTGVTLANEHKIVIEARSSSMNFDKIKVSRAIRLIVEERTTGNIIVRAPQSIMPYISLKVSDGTLSATLLSGTPVSRNSNVVAEVYIPYNGRINEITTSSAARVIVKPTLSCKELELEASSASVIEVKAGTKEVSIDASGASTIKAELATDEFDMELSGASVATISGQITDGDIEVSGASTLKAEKLRAAKLDLECSGASRANALAVICSAKASGASAVTVECLQQLNVSASGASTIRYSGDCQVNTISNTGASSICKK